jgi:hypothetical protein
MLSGPVRFLPANVVGRASPARATFVVSGKSSLYAALRRVEIRCLALMIAFLV